MRTISHEAMKSSVIILSLFFALYIGALGLFQPFITLHFHSLGMSGVQIGVLTTVSSLLALLSAPIIGSIYDKSSHKRLLFITLLVLSGVFLLLIGWIKYYPLVIILFSIYRIGASTNIPIAENLAYSVGGRKGEGKRFGFGFMRLWGSIAFTMTALAGGWFAEKFNLQGNFVIFLGFMLLAASLMFFLSPEMFDHTKKKISSEHPQDSSILRIIFRDKYLLLLIAAMALTHPLGNGIRQFEPIFMSQLQIRQSMIGLAAALSALTEVPFMLWADYLIHRFGITKILLVVFAIDLSRRLLVWFFPIGWMVFVTHVATSISFSMRLVTTVSLVNLRIPAKHTTTSLALISMTIYSISNMISSAVSGLLFDVYGGRTLYLYSAVGCLISLCLSLLARKIEMRAKESPQIVSV